MTIKQSLASETRLRAFAESFPDIAWITDADGDPAYFNRRWYDYTGLSRQKSEEAGWTSALHPDDLAPAVRRWKHAIKTGLTNEFEYRLRASDGQYRWFVGRALPQRGNGEILCWLGMCRDIDDQKHAEDELRRSEERFRLLAEAIPEMVWMATPRGDVVYFNQRWLNYTGLTYEEARGQGWIEAIHPDDRQSALELWSWAVRRGESLDLEQRLRRGLDGAYRWHQFRGVPLRDDDEVIFQWVGTFTDIDDQRRHAEVLERLVLERTIELRRSNLELEQFASIASHDLQEPLRKIEAFGDRLKAKCAQTLTERGTEYLEHILKSAYRMRNLIDDLLAYSRINVDRQPLVEVDLTAVAMDAMSDLDELIQRSGGCVELGPLPTIQADPSQMRQLFQNLIGNALKFHRTGVPPVISVRAQPLSGSQEEMDPTACARQEIAIADNGIGFDEADRERIFQVFERLRGRCEYEGTGMGLAICRKIVARHHGQITARSQPGEGSTFLVTLPVRPPERGPVRSGSH